MKRTIIRLVDDIDGSEAHETKRFTVSDVDYEIDLSVANVKKLTKALDDAAKVIQDARAQTAKLLAPFVEHATKVQPMKTMRGKGARRTVPNDKAQNAAIRTWAAKKGFDVAPRGRIRAEIVEQYHAEAGRK